MNFLERVVLAKEREIAGRRKRVPLAALKRGIRRSKRSFRRALAAGKGPALIAEVKLRSPSQGRLAGRNGLGLKERVALYSKYADAISVITDRKFFSGSLEALEQASKLSGGLPVLAKDFVIDEYQVYEARKRGADAVLLIASILTQRGLKRLIRAARNLGMHALVEVNSAGEMQDALHAGAGTIGINNRNLKTLRIDRGNVKKVLGKTPAGKLRGKLIVAESGIGSREDIESLPARVDAVLVGSAIAKAGSARAKLRELRGIPLVKVCGITSKKDAIAAVKAGADFLGFNFYGGSPRCISPEKAARIIKAVRTAAGSEVKAVGVFVNEKRSEVRRIARKCGLDMLQFHGDEKPGFVNSFEAGRVIRALRVRSPSDLRGINKYKSEFILLDACAPEKGYGGTGRRLSSAVLKAAGKIKGKKVFISGGLKAANAGAAIRAARPFAADACSCIEGKKGKKSAAKMGAFARAVERA